MASSPTLNSSPASSTSSTPVPTRGRPTVQSLLDELSDSDSDAKPAVEDTTRSIPIKSFREEALSGDESSDHDVPLGGGRLASRLAGLTAGKPTEVADEPVAVSSEHFQHNQEVWGPNAGGTCDDQATASIQPRKRLLLKRKRTSEDGQSSISPQHIGQNDSLLQKSPTPTPSTGLTHRSSSPELPAHEDEPISISGKSKFQILVEKARKEREAREAADKAKRAVIDTSHERRPRGSSPADGTEEDSDHSQTAAAMRLTKTARPTRKAGKKALEELSRETQRITRNMQLAHQARTKKKFSKESFFASFSGIAPPSDSMLSSGSENDMPHDTPPTSPLRSPPLNKKATATTSDEPLIDIELHGVPEKDSFEDIFASRREDGIKLAISTAGTVLSKGQLEAHDRSTTILSGHRADVQNLSGSDSEIEVIYTKGDQRKFAAFENMPKKKAKEMPSHLALRSLAYIRPEKDGKSAMSRANMDVSLIRRARKQALDERREKIEKLKAAGVVIQTTEEKEQEEEELENLVERAREEDEAIRKREKELAKKDGTYVKDALDEDDSDDEDDDEDFHDEDQDEQSHSDTEGDTEAEADDEHDEEDEQQETGIEGLIDDIATETSSDDGAEDATDIEISQNISATPVAVLNRASRRPRVVLDDEEDEDDAFSVAQSPLLPSARKTPQSILRSTRKVIPGLQHSDDLPIGLTQAFAATMAESQTQGNELTQEQDSMDILRDLPSPQISMVPRLARLESMDMISESVPATQTQSLGLDLGLSQSQVVPESPAAAHVVAASQAPFDLTQDAGYSFSPFEGNRFAETPRREPKSTEETVILTAGEQSPIVHRKGKLQRGRQSAESTGEYDQAGSKSAFQVMDNAARRATMEEFNKKKSEARRAIDEAAEESDDEYAGLGGASDDDSNDEENEDDRRMIDEDTQVGHGDEAKLAQLHANREREADEAAVNKMMKDITTGALRRKRGIVDDLDLSDEEDAKKRRREAKQREFAKMRRELLKDENIGKIAEDKKKQAFLKSIEDNDDNDEEDNSFDLQDSLTRTDSQDLSQPGLPEPDLAASISSLKPLQPSNESQLNQLRSNTRRSKVAVSRKPGTLAEIRESVSFLIEEPDTQAGDVDLDLSDSEDEPEAYVNLDRHLFQAEADEDALDNENTDLGDFIVDDDNRQDEDDDQVFRKPELPSEDRSRAPFSERRTQTANVIDRLSLLRQASSSSASNSNPSSKMAFFSSRTGSGGLTSGPSLLRRATTNSSLGSMSGRENVSATGVVTSKTERGSAAQEKDFVRKGASTSRNAVNYQGRQSLKEEKMSARAGIMKKQQKKKSSGFLSSLFRGDTWG